MPFEFKDGSTPGVCRVCGEPAWSARSNRCLEHKINKPLKVKVEKTSTKINGEAPPPRDGDKSTVKQVVETAGAIDRRTFSSKPPTVAEWTDKLSSLAVLLTMTYVEYRVVKPLGLPEPTASEAVAQLGMTDEEAQTIVAPFAYLLQKTPANKKYGREAIEVLAFAPAILAILEWQQRVTQFKNTVARELATGPSPVQSRGGSRVDTSGHETEGGGAGVSAPVANFGGPGNWDPDAAPSKRVNGRRDLVDESY